MNLPQIEYFLALCQTMNFTEAAKNLYISQPALSKQIATMERELGVTLFDRSYRNLTLTPAGEFLRDSFGKIQSDYNAAVNMCRKIYADHDSQITVAFLTGWNVGRFIPDISSLVSDHFLDAKISVQSLTGERLVRSLLENVVDIAVLPSFIAAELPGVKFLELGQIHYCLFYSGSHYAADGRKPTIKDFEKETFYILPGDPKYSALQHLVDTCAEYRFTPVTEVLPNLESMISCLQTGMGVAMFDTIHKLCANPIFQTIVLPKTVSVCAAWKDGPRGKRLRAMAEKLTLSE